MKADDLDLRELLQFEHRGGVISFGGERVLLFDAVALGLLRKELITTLGSSAARAVLTRFGYAHGRRTALALRDALPWDSEEEWRNAGARLHALRGTVISQPVAPSPDDPHPPFLRTIWTDSYEAEQHVLHQGLSSEPVCWTLTGFANGYFASVHAKEVLCMEERCRGRGDAVCELVARTPEDWGPELAAQLRGYQTGPLDETLVAVTRELRKVETRLRARQHSLAGSPATKDDTLGIVAESEPMKRILDLARRVAKADSTVLVTGESGVGKERVARFLHAESTRRAGPFVAINCGAIPESLLESELFGHARGAFTGANQERPGLFEAANGGTLFLDEIGEVPPAMQVKLLRTLQEREVRRVGENRTRSIDVRLLAATNRDLVAEVHAGRFRQDLYYRLRVVELHLPALRERRADILLLARAFLAEAAERAGRKVTGLTPDAANQLLRYAWPGNVRELGNAIEHAVVLAARARIDLEDLPEEVKLASASTYVPGSTKTLADVERDYILAVVEATGGNRADAAKQLGIGEATLYRKLKEYRATARGSDGRASSKKTSRPRAAPSRPR